jgi:hypothetical protein
MAILHEDMPAFLQAVSFSSLFYAYTKQSRKVSAYVDYMAFLIRKQTSKQNGMRYF